MKKLEEKLDKIEFDPDLSPTNQYNIKVAQNLGLRYDSSRLVYVDSEDNPVRDAFGQPLG